MPNASRPRGDRQAKALGVAAAACGVCALIAAVMAAVDGAHLAPQAPAATSPPTPPRPAATVAGLPASTPTRVTIPAIRVRSALTRAGLDPDGALQPPRPPHQDQAAWYTGSVTPGQRGTAVVEGHLDSTSGPSVFFRLGALHRGDQVTVDRADRTTAVFTIDTVRRYPKHAFPTQAVYANTPNPSLRLITCGGDFDDRGGHYRDNTVVFAHLTTVFGRPRR